MNPLACDGTLPIYYCSYRAHQSDDARRRRRRRHHHDEDRRTKPSSSTYSLSSTQSYHESSESLSSQRPPPPERTPSLILADAFLVHPWQATDAEAAECVVRHYLLNRHLDSRQIDAEHHLLRLLLSSPLHETSLLDIVRYADILFFEGLLGPNVDLRWSSGDEVGQKECLNGGGWEGDFRASRFRTTTTTTTGRGRPPPHGHGHQQDPSLVLPVIIGTTVLRSTRSNAFEARIILSDSILHSGRYDQRLVLSTILHETIHAYLFVRRGLPATAEGGHTAGFKAIARFLDEWIGDLDYLRLSHDRADLKKFRVPDGHGPGWDPETRSWGQKGVDFILMSSEVKEKKK
ncbi:MAG: hypothetical protein M1823_000896 [Watsoniomyces obsoletus]|nr:MAG: hypothetical protein M1823_000896 [Watsoniomyces obsoletus]